MKFDRTITFRNILNAENEKRCLHHEDVQKIGLQKIRF
jgi:hypothetical protein